MSRPFRLLALFATPLALSACRGDATAPVLTARVVSVAPSGGTLGVYPNASIVVTFNHAMRAGMEAYAAVHEGDGAGTVVAGRWAWSDDRGTLTFTPAAPWKALTRYVLHLGGGMRAADGGFVDYGPCVKGYGGQWATQSMMGGGMVSGGMTGSGWRHPNGTYGVTFSFTTG